MSTLYDALLDLVFPPRCPGCGQRGAVLCARCADRCRRLRTEPPDQSQSGRRPGLLTTVAVLYAFDSPLREAIHSFKCRRRRSLAGPLGALLVEALPERLQDCDVVIAAPLHAGRQRERGFNQSGLLAAAAATALDKPIESRLIRGRATDHQVGMDRAAREANVRGAFLWHGSAAPRSILLPDDVMTTGSTMRECARALRAAGAREIHAVALAGEWMY